MLQNATFTVAIYFYDLEMTFMVKTETGIMADVFRHCLRQEYVIVIVYLPVSLSLTNFAQKLPNGFAKNFQGRVGQ